MKGRRKMTPSSQTPSRRLPLTNSKLSAEEAIFPLRAVALGKPRKGQDNKRGLA